MVQTAIVPAVEAALAAMQGKRALLIGDLLLDTYIYGETGRVSREAPVLVVRKERAEHRLGGAANTAANLAALGLHTTVIGTVGSDDDGRLLCQMLENYGACAAGVMQAEGLTAVKTRILAGAPGTSKQQVLRLDNEPKRTLSDALQRQVLAAIESHSKNADVVVVSDYGLGLMQPQVVGAISALAKAGVPVCVDSRYHLQHFAGVLAVTPNLPESEAAVGFALDSAEAVQRAGNQLVKQHSFGACLLTQGRGGMSLFTADGTVEHISIVGEEEVTDVTGAGDTVIATFAASVAAGLGMRNGMRLANCAAGIVVTKTGTAVARPTEIVTAAQRFAVELLPWE